MAERIVHRRGYRKGLGGEMCAEFLGTFVLILFGVGSVAVAVAGLPDRTPDGGLRARQLAHHLVGMGPCRRVRRLRGRRHQRSAPQPGGDPRVRGPRDFPWRKVLPYWLAQVVGAFVAAALVYACYRWAIDAAIAKAGETRETSLNTYSIFATFPAEYFGKLPGGARCSTRSWAPGSCSC
ncbi:Aquaporin Z [Streptomyces tanashiensis]